MEMKWQIFLYEFLKLFYVLIFYTILNSKILQADLTTQYQNLFYC